jgi:myo-inositol-1(or 4)-monophosphatase
MMQDELLKFCREVLNLSHNLVKKVGEKSRKEVFDKHVTDISTEMDRLISSAIIDFFKMHKVPAIIYSEEKGRIELSKKPEVTIAFDDLDGTNNYFTGRGILPFCTVVTFFNSIGTKFSDAVVAGIIEHNSGSVWLASKGQGCFYKDKKCETSGKKELNKKSVVIIDHYMTDVTKGIGLYKKVWVKDFGTAALHFAGVASGMFDAYVSSAQKAHELGAGFLMIKEAGGCVLDWHGKPIDGLKYDFNGKYPIVAACTEDFAKEILKVLRK